MNTRTTSVARWKWFCAYAAFCTVLAVLASVETYVMQLKWDKPVAWSLAFRRSFEEVYSYGAMALGVLWFCNRMRFNPARVWRWVLAHTGGYAVFTLGALALVAWLWSGQRSVKTGELLRFNDLFPKLAITCAISSFYHYWIIVLGHLGWQYYRAYRERERQAAVLTTELVQARLHALRMQLNPHFLFNTLNTVLALIHESPSAADRMLVRLSLLLRRTLETGQTHEVPLREELDLLRLYLDIEATRFEDRLAITFAVEPRAEEFLVPQFILQPLAENALRHGILPREQPGRLEISASVEGDTLELAVRDNGAGLPEEPGAFQEGVGLANVRSRLAHLYGNAHRFTVRNTPGGGVEARISMPCRRSSPSGIEAEPQAVAEVSASRRGPDAKSAAAALGL